MHWTNYHSLHLYSDPCSHKLGILISAYDSLAFLCIPTLSSAYIPNLVHSIFQILAKWLCHKPTAKLVTPQHQYKVWPKYQLLKNSPSYNQINVSITHPNSNSNDHHQQPTILCDQIHPTHHGRKPILTPSPSSIQHKPHSYTFLYFHFHHVPGHVDFSLFSVWVGSFNSCLG